MAYLSDLLSEYGGQFQSSQGQTIYFDYFLQFLGGKTDSLLLWYE